MKIFISYEHGDATVADVIRERLTRPGLAVFVDRHGLAPGDNFESVIVDSIKRCDWFLVLWSVAASSSVWVNKEVVAAKEFDRRIVPIMLDDAQPHPLLQSLHRFDWQPESTAIDRLVAALGLEMPLPSVGPAVSREGLAQAIAKYRARIGPDYANIRILGSAPELPFEAVYIPQKVCLEGTGGKVCTLASLLPREAAGRTIILGPPGSGKTTLLRYLAHVGTRDEATTIPVFVPITRLLASRQELDAWIADLLKGKIGAGDARVVMDADEDFASSLLLLLDGIDEIPEQDYRSFLGLLQRFANRFPRSSVVMTSRLTGFATADFHEFRVYRLQPLEEAEIRGYIDARCPPESRQRVWSTIRNHERLFELAQTPFMLAMMCAAPDDVGVRATQRATLFEVCTKYLLRRLDYQPGRQHESDETLGKYEKVLQFIAVRFFKLDFADSFQDDELIRNIQLIPGYSTEAPEILKGISATTGLLQHTRAGYHFVHRSIWEFFVAQGMKHEPLDHLLARANVPSWEEPIRLFVGLTRSDDLPTVVGQLWERNRGLALRAMNEVAPFPEALLRELNEKVQKEDRLRILKELCASMERCGSDIERRRMLLDTLSSLSRCERDCEVLYHIIAMLEEDGTPEARDLVARILDLGSARERLRRYAGDAAFHVSFVSCPAGTFSMGSDSTPDARERPAHQVELSPFLMGAKLVTNALYYDAFPYSCDRRNEYSSEASQPVNNVNWYEAVLFARWLGCDLPTEAEWEYACRAGGADDAILFDPARLEEFAWYGANSENRTHPVGTKRPNSWGLFDMHGNLREWCKDWHDDAYYSFCVAHNVRNDPQGPRVGTNRVLRGGTFDWAVTNLRPTYRNFNVPSNVYFANGFRLVFRGPSPFEVDLA